MAHQLATTNDRTAMMYSGETPWHGLGTRLEEPATASEAITAAGLNYFVQLQSLETTSQIPVTQRRAVVRTDNKTVLGVVGNSYQPVQNESCFSFLDEVVADGSLRYHTAGALGQGEKIWMLAKLPGEIHIKNTDDVTERYLLLSNSHDGTSSLRVFFTPIRVVCANTLGMAERRGKGQGVSIIHKGDLSSKVREAQKILGLAHRFYADFDERVNHLARHTPTVKQVENYFALLYPDTAELNRQRARNVRHQLMHLFEHGRGQELSGIRHTSWAAFNAVTEYVDHHRSTRGQTSQDRAAKRLESAWFGSGATLKATAWKLAMEMAV
jgi:phage/plasmid-like protein (TIGR03299 family)